MLTTYQLNSSELDENFILALKQLFAGKAIRIVVTELDETEYLMSMPANRERLLQAIRDIESGKPLQPFDWESPL